MMKNKVVVLVVVILAAFCYGGCATTPKITDVPYAFVEKEKANGTAIIFLPRKNIRILDVEGEQLPAPAEGTRWYPFHFPAGREFKLRVYVLYRYHYNEKGGSYYDDEPEYRRRGIFICPPLEAGKKYKLWYQREEKNYSGAGRLILTYDNVESLYRDYTRMSPIYVQEIPPLVQE